MKDFTLEVERGEFIVLIGPSGCGKSTTLRMINRLIQHSSGSIEIEGKDFLDYHPVELRRRLGYVIQQIGLIPHMTIADNISFVLKLQKIPEATRRSRAEELLKLVEMDPEVYLDRYPRELSGGQQQRIGVLRALAHDPDIILMDEPFGALDPITRDQLQDEFRRLQRAVQKTIIFVTHDMDEALKMADRIVIMRSGEIVQVATPEDMLRSPADEFVADFIGRQRLLRQASEVIVSEVMSTHAVSLPATSGLAQALELMRRRRVDSVIAVDKDNVFQGLAFLKDVQEALSQNDTRHVGEFLKLQDATVTREQSVLNVVHHMLVHRLDAIPVIDEAGKVVGVVTRGALVGILDDAIQASLSQVSTDSVAGETQDAMGSAAATTATTTDDPNAEVASTAGKEVR